MSHRVCAESQPAFFITRRLYSKSEVAEKYGVYLHNVGEADRALFVIDGKGAIRCSYLSPIGVSPGADGILNAPEALQKDNQAAKKRIPEKEMVEAL